MVKNRKCLSCGTQFKYCPDCSRADALKPAWASQFCSESCATLWSTLTKFGMDRLTKSEAKSIISDLDLKSVESYSACVQRDLAKVMTEEKKSKRNKRIEIQPIDEVIDAELEIAEPIVVEVEAEVKEIFEDHAVVEAWINDSENKTLHEVVIKKENE